MCQCKTVNSLITQVTCVCGSGFTTSTFCSVLFKYLVISYRQTNRNYCPVDSFTLFCLVAVVLSTLPGDAGRCGSKFDVGFACFVYMQNSASSKEPAAVCT